MLSAYDRRVQMVLTQQVGRMRMKGVCDSYEDGLRMIHQQLSQEGFPVGKISDWMEKWGGE